VVLLADNRPNFLLIISDDHRADWMGHKGHPQMETPHLDRLAAEGISFPNAFVTSGVCSPSRASILTGRYAHRASAPEIVWCNASFLENQVNLAENLQAAGYRTGYIGKLHLGREEEPMRGFDYWASFPFVGNFHNQPLWINGKKTPFRGFTDDRIAELSAEKIREWSAADRPFFLIVGLKAPHIPFDYPERMKDRLTDAVFDKPTTWSEPKPGLQGNCLPATEFPPAIPAYGNFQNWVRSYSRLALTIDDSVGTIVKAVDEAGAADRTMVIYTSDQGYSLGEFGLSEKHYAYEQVMRVPMIVRYPRLIEPGTDRPQMVLNLDLAPTILDLAGAKPLEGMDGESWARLFRGENPEWREDFFFAYTNEWVDPLPPMHALRTETHKLIVHESKPVRELYDLAADPLERHDLYDDPSAASVRADLEKRLETVKADLQFAPREVRLLEQAWIIGPVAEEDEAALRASLLAGEIPADAQWSSQPFDFAAHGIAPGDSFYVAVPVERLTPYDPYVTFDFITPGTFRKHGRQGVPFAAYTGKGLLWMNRAYAKTLGQPYAPTGDFNEKCNYPLGRQISTAVFRGIAPPSLRAFQIEVQLPAGQARFLPQDPDAADGATRSSDSRSEQGRYGFQIGHVTAEQLKDSKFVEQLGGLNF
jgi:arylsulfatase A-like enzyme